MADAHIGQTHGIGHNVVRVRDRGRREGNPMIITRRLAAVVAAGALVVAPALAVAPQSFAAENGVTLTSAQLTEGGFPKKPNLTAWAGGTANLPSDSAAQWQDVVITGKAPKGTPVGQVLTMSRYVPQDTNGDGEMKPLNITGVVQKDLSYSVHFQLGMPGTYGYSVGYDTTSFSPEFIGFQFQFTTTGTGKASPSSGSSQAVHLGPKKLAEAGFTKSVNTVGWGGTATISTHKAPAGSPVTVKGTAPSYVKPGTILQLNRFVATDKQGSGHFESVSGAQTMVAADGTFALTFEVNQKGVYGYTLGAPENDEWVGMEFQLKTT